MILIIILLMHDKVGELSFLLRIKEFQLVYLLVLDRNFRVCAVTRLLRQTLCRLGMLGQVLLLVILQIIFLDLLPVFWKLELKESLVFIHVLFGNTLFIGCFFLDRMKTFKIFI